jgi:hypothetical protein
VRELEGEQHAKASGVENTAELSYAMSSALFSFVARTIDHLRNVQARDAH